MNNRQTFSFEPIGYVASPFKQKFGIPRQSGLTTSLSAEVILHSPYNHPDILRGLSHVSHIWVIFVFSETYDQGWSPTVRPPRLGGNKRTGVLATRSPFRPNPIGLSVVRLLRCYQRENRWVLEIANADLLHGTPVLDIKPYLPYADSMTEAHYPLGEKPRVSEQAVQFSQQAEQKCGAITHATGLPVKQQIEEILRCDPRPAYQTDHNRVYGILLHHYNVTWQALPDQFFVITIEEA